MAALAIHHQHSRHTPSSHYSGFSPLPRNENDLSGYIAGVARRGEGVGTKHMIKK